jgi:hypothetical protein
MQTSCWQLLSVHSSSYSCPAQDSKRHQKQAGHSWALVVQAIVTPGTAQCSACLCHLLEVVLAQQLGPPVWLAAAVEQREEEELAGACLGLAQGHATTPATTDSGRGSC